MHYFIGYVGALMAPLYIETTYWQNATVCYPPQCSTGSTILLEINPTGLQHKTNNQIRCSKCKIYNHRHTLATLRCQRIPYSYVL